MGSTDGGDGGPEGAGVGEGAEDTLGGVNVVPMDWGAEGRGCCS